MCRRSDIDLSVKSSHFLHFITNFPHYLYSKHYSSHFTVGSADCLHYGMQMMIGRHAWFKRINMNESVSPITAKSESTHTHTQNTWTETGIRSTITVWFTLYPHVHILSPIFVFSSTLQLTARPSKSKNQNRQKHTYTNSKHNEISYFDSLFRLFHSLLLFCHLRN